MDTPAPSQVLARKWRPRTFDDMVGQETIVQALRHALRSGRLHQAYLLTGTRGVGKTTLARLMARGLNCEQGPTDVPCGHCPACIGIEQGRFPDLLEVDAATNTRVEEMRELLENTQYLPVAGRFKVYLIDEVHMLSRSAFNAMLKTLEEPPPHVKFILATTDPQKVPVTVLSRCLQFSLHPLPSTQIADRLRHVLEQEQLSFEASALPLLAQAAQGSLRDALSLLDQALAFGGGEVRKEPVRAMLGTLERSALLDLVRALAEGDGETLIACADTLAEHSLSFDHALQELAVLFHDLALLQAVPNAPALQDSARELGVWKERWPASALQLLYQIAVQARRDLPFAPDERAGFRMALLRLLAFQPGPPGPLPAPPPGSALALPDPAPAPAASIPQRARLPPAIDDWAGLVERLQLMGMAHELARHVEWLGMTQHQIRLRLARKFSHLLPYQEHLRTGLESFLDCDLRLSIELGEEEEGTSVAQQEARTQAQAHQQALQTLTQDPFAQAVRDALGGTLVESSVKPLPQGEKS